MRRPYNFNAGPAILPESVLKKAQQGVLNFNNLGLSMMEISHRSPQFKQILNEAQDRLKEILNIPTNYQVLCLGMPARAHFALIAMNFLKEKASYLISGHWSSMAFLEASKFGNVQVVANGRPYDYLALPPLSPIDKNSDYFYFTPNETLTGFTATCPKDLSLPVIADMTSCLLSEPIDISQYDLIFAGTQKNMGAAGLSLVIIKDDFLKKNNADLARIFDYQVQAENESLFATPPMFNIYLSLLVFEWLLSQGGISAIYQKNQQKAALLYDTIDKSPFYHALVENKSHRSLVNVTFNLADKNLETLFLNKAEQQGLVGLKGHRLVGGIRASLYNAMPMEGVRALVEFMESFASQAYKA